MSNKVDSERVARLKVNTLRVMVLVAMLLTVAAAFFVPGFVGETIYAIHGVRDHEVATALVVYIYACILPFLIALWVVKQLCDVISAGDSFSEKTLKKLSAIVWCCIAEMVISAAAIPVFGYFFKFQIFMVNLFLLALAAVIAVFATVLKELVKSAMRIREENELTI